MATGSPSLIAHIREKIRAEGSVSFAWFMEQALYHAMHGYYSSGRARIGRDGDYFSNVSVGPLFGRLMAAQFREMWEKLEWPNEFKIVEQGAHEGDFARDVLESCASFYPEFFAKIRYEIVEPFPVLRLRQRERLNGFAKKIEWKESLDDLPPFRGVHFSNELLDAMPVHLVKWLDNRWHERFVIETDGAFSLEDRPLEDQELRTRTGLIPLPLPDAYETEINLEALRWVDAVSAKLEAGFILAVDYGFPRDGFFSPHRSHGTLQCYARHRVRPSPLENVGETDITAHVEWTSLMERARANGLTSAGFTDQHHFITGLLSKTLATSTDDKFTRALNTLMHPGFLGMKFQYLGLARNVKEAASLSGFRFAPASPR